MPIAIAEIFIKPLRGLIVSLSENVRITMQLNMIPPATRVDLHFPALKSLAVMHPDVTLLKKRNRNVITAFSSQLIDSLCISIAQINVDDISRRTPMHPAIVPRLICE